MNKFLLALYIAIAPLMSYGAPAGESLAGTFPSAKVKTSYTINPNAKDTITAGITNASSIVTRNCTAGMWAPQIPCEFVVDATTTGQFVKWLVASYPTALTSNGAICSADFWIKGDATLAKFYISTTANATGKIAGTEVLYGNLGTLPVFKSIEYPCTASAGLVYESTGNAAAVTITKIEHGETINSGVYTPSAMIAGQSYFAKTTSCLWTRTNTALGDFSTLSACPGPTIDGTPNLGTWLTTDTDLPQQTINNLPGGDYELTVMTYTYGSTSQAATNWAVSDGTTTAVGQPFAQPAGANYETGTTIHAKFSYTGTGNRTFKLQCSASGGTCNIDNQIAQTVFLLKYFPTPAQTTNVTRMNIRTEPTYTILTTGTAQTYTVPVGVTRLEVTVVGGGGGGAGGGSGAIALAGDGGASNFGTTLLVGNGGKGGGAQSSDGFGGAATTSGVTGGNTQKGSDGGGGQYTSSSGAQMTGGMGGNSTLSGAGMPGGYTGGGCSVGNPAGTNSGSGGGGASCFGNGLATGGGGGGGGTATGSLSVSSGQTFTYTVGASGAAGAAGGGGNTGGLGGAGKIIIKEIYQGGNTPLVQQGVRVLDNPYGVSTINTIKSVSANYTATTDEETILVDSSGGSRTISLPAAASVKGKKYEIQQTSSTNVTTIDPNASETVCGQTTIKVTAKDSIIIQSDGTNWIGLNGGCTKTAIASLGMGTGCPFSQDGNWIASCTGGSGDCVCTLQTGFWGNGSAVCEFTPTDYATTISFGLAARGTTSSNVMSIKSNYNVGSGAWAAAGGSTDIVCRGIR